MENWKPRVHSNLDSARAFHRRVHALSSVKRRKCHKTCALLHLRLSGWNSCGALHPLTNRPQKTHKVLGIELWKLCGPHIRASQAALRFHRAQNSQTYAQRDTGTLEGDGRSNQACRRSRRERACGCDSAVQDQHCSSRSATTRTRATTRANSTTFSAASEISAEANFKQAQAARTGNALPRR